MRRDQTAEVRRRLLSAEGYACGRQLYFDALPNGRTRAGEIARRMGKQLVSEPCRHRSPEEPSYCDYRLADPEQLRLEAA